MNVLKQIRRDGQRSSDNGAMEPATTSAMPQEDAISGPTINQRLYPTINQQLYHASYCGNADLSTRLLQQGANVDFTDCDLGETPLHAASSKGHSEIARLLIEYGAKVNARDNCFDTPLHVASLNGRSKVIELLLKNGADAEAKNGGNQTPLQKAKHANVIQALKSHVAAPCNQNSASHSRQSIPNESRLTATAAEAEATNVNASGRCKYPSLHVSSWNGHSKIVELLLETAADDTNAENNQSLLQQVGLTDDVKETHITSRDQNQQLWIAARNGDEDLTAQILQQENINVDFKGGKFELTPLHAACHNGHLKIAQLLIENEADVNAKHRDNRTPLHSASKMGHLEVVKLLLNSGADMEAKDRHENRTALHEASNNGHSEIVELLLKNGVDANAKNKDNWTPLHRAGYNGHFKVAQLLLNFNANVNAKTENANWTPLHGASSYGHFEIVQLLIDHNANTNSKSRQCVTPLHKASRRGHLEIVKLLLKNSADAETLDRNNRTPLRYAKDAGHTNVIQALESWIGAPTNPSMTKQNAQEKSDVVHAASLAGQEGHYGLENGQQDTESITSPSNGWHYSEEVLAHLVEQFDLLYAVAMDKRQDLDEQIERRAIFASKDHREFYGILFHKLDCTVIACKSLASDMVQQCSQGSYREWFSSVVAAKSVKAIMDKTPLGQLVRDSIKWAAEQVPLPFVKTFGAIIHTLCSFKYEHDKYLAVARLAVFASIAEEMGGTSKVLVRVSRYMIRSGRFVGKQPEFAPWQKWALEMMAEASTRSQAQGCLVAELVLECIMKPRKDCPIQKILNGQDSKTTLDVAISSLVLGLPVKDVVAMVPFVTAEARQQVIASVHNVSVGMRAPPIAGTDSEGQSSMVGIVSLDPSDSLLTTTTIDTISKVTSSMTNALDVDLLEVLARLRAVEEEKEKDKERLLKLEEENKKLRDHVSKIARNPTDDKQDIDAGGGLVQMYANEEQRYHGRLERLEQDMVVTYKQISNLTAEQIEQRESAEDHARDIQAQMDAIRIGNHQPRGWPLFRSSSKPVNTGDRAQLDP